MTEVAKVAFDLLPEKVGVYSIYDKVGDLMYALWDGLNWREGTFNPEQCCHDYGYLNHELEMVLTQRSLHPIEHLTDKIEKDLWWHKGSSKPPTPGIYRMYNAKGFQWARYREDGTWGSAEVTIYKAVHSSDVQIDAFVADTCLWADYAAPVWAGAIDWAQVVVRVKVPPAPGVYKLVKEDGTWAYSFWNGVFWHTTDSSGEKAAVLKHQALDIEAYKYRMMTPEPVTIDPLKCWLSVVTYPSPKKGLYKIVLGGKKAAYARFSDGQWFEPSAHQNTAAGSDTPTALMIQDGWYAGLTTELLPQMSWAHTEEIDDLEAASLYAPISAPPDKIGVYSLHLGPHPTAYALWDGVYWHTPHNTPAKAAKATFITSQSDIVSTVKYRSKKHMGLEINPVILWHDYPAVKPPKGKSLCRVWNKPHNTPLGKYAKWDGQWYVGYDDSEKAMDTTIPSIGIKDDGVFWAAADAPDHPFLNKWNSETPKDAEPVEYYTPGATDVVDYTPAVAKNQSNWIGYVASQKPGEIGIYQLRTDSGIPLYSFWNGHFWSAIVVNPAGTLQPGAAPLYDLGEYKVKFRTLNPIDFEIPFRALMVRARKVNPAHPGVYKVCVPCKQKAGYSYWDGKQWRTLLALIKAAKLSEGISEELNGKLDCFWHVQQGIQVSVENMANFITMANKEIASSLVGVSDPTYIATVSSQAVTAQSIQIKIPDPVSFKWTKHEDADITLAPGLHQSKAVAQMASTMVDALVLLNGYDNGISKKAAFEVCFRMIQALTDAGFPVPDFEAEQ